MVNACFDVIHVCKEIRKQFYIGCCRQEKLTRAFIFLWTESKVNLYDTHVNVSKFQSMSLCCKYLSKVPCITPYPLGDPNQAISTIIAFVNLNSIIF